MKRSISTLLILSQMFCACAALAEVAPPVKIAIVAGDGDRAPKAGVVDLLTAELSKHGDVVLLEREEVKRILAEQQLSAAGLVEPETAVKAGRVLAVDVFAVVEQLREKSEPTLCRMQAIEARTGILLAGTFVAEKDLAATPSPLADAILSAAGKARVPDLAIRGSSRQLELPSLAEGFDSLQYVRLDDQNQFVEEAWNPEV